MDKMVKRKMCVYIGASSPAFSNQGSTDSREGRWAVPSCCPWSQWDHGGPSLLSLPPSPSLTALLLALSVRREPGRRAACACQPCVPGSAAMYTVLDETAAQGKTVFSAESHSQSWLLPEPGC